MTPIYQALAIGALTVGGGAAAVGTMNRDIPDLAVPEGPWQPGAALDGQVFHTVDTIIASGETMRDTLHFVDGRFQSEKCQDYCDFGWSEYRTMPVDDAVAFTATTRCPDAPHTVVWHGTVSDGTLRFEATWTTRRWYWTQQIAAEGTGTLSPAGPAAIEG